MKTFVVAGVAAVVFCAPAFAADFPMKAAPDIWNWSGTYAGADVGYAWGHDTVSPTIADGGTFPRTNKMTTDGVFWGGTFGYNFQNGNLVYGLEGDLGGLGIAKSRAEVGGGTEVDHIKNGIYGDVTARLGYAFDQTLLYAKGGVAFYDSGANTSTAVAGYALLPAQAFTGWTVGGGIEYRINRAWSIKAEYLHFDFGSATATLNNGTLFGYKNNLSIDTVKVGINIHG